MRFGYRLGADGKHLEPEQGVLWEIRSGHSMRASRHVKLTAEMPTAGSFGT